MIKLVVVIVLSYLAGSFPTSIIVGKIFRRIDIREHGSGNAGATNVLRVMGWKLALMVMVVDVGKGILATLGIAQLANDATTLNYSLVQIIAGTSAVVGHIFTVFAGFRGGKGVGTGAGVIFSLYPIPTSICLVVFLAIAFTTRYVSLASMSAALLLPLLLLAFRYLFQTPVDNTLFLFALCVVLLIIFAHRSNIRRLLNSTENRFGKSSDSES